MSSIVYLNNKKTNTIYAYLNESVWDPETKRCICKRKCIGHLDPDTGEIVSNRHRKEKNCAKVKSSALCMVFDSVSKKIGLTETMSQAFQINWRIMLSTAYYLAATGNEILFCKQWSETNDTPYGDILTNDVIRNMLGNIAAYHISNFFTRWIEKNQCTEVYTNTILFRTTYDALAKYAATLGVTIDKENYGSSMELYFSAKDGLPMCYTLMNMNLGRNLDNYGIKHTDFKKLTIISDCEREDGFELEDLGDPKKHVTARVCIDSPLAEAAIEKVRDRIMNPENYRVIYGTPLFIASSMNYLYGKKYYTHVCFDTNRAISELLSFISIVNGCMHELKTGDRRPEHEAIYEKYLICSADEDALIIDHNGENILHHDVNTGFSVVVSNTNRDPEMALSPFFEDKLVNEMFRNILNDYDNTNLNLFTESYHQTRIFIQFIALVLRTEIERVMGTSGLNKTITYKELIDELNNIKTVTVPGVRKKHLTDTNPIQKRILKAFNVDPGTSSKDIRTDVKR